MEAKKVGLAKAAPARRAPVMKLAGKLAAKAKRTAKAPAAASSFVDVAMKAKAKVGDAGSPPGSGTWYFMKDLRKTKVGADDAEAWAKYDAKMNKQLEMAYSKGFSQYTMKHKDAKYIVKFASMVQFRADDTYLQRPVKRL